MAVDFAQDSVTYKAKRVYAPIGTFNEFAITGSAWVNATQSGFSDRGVNQKSYSFTGVKNIVEDATGEVYCTFKVVSKLPGIYPDLITGLNSYFAQEQSDSEGGMGLGNGYTSVEDVAKRNWKATLTGTYTANGDKVTLALDESYAWLTYHTPEALAAMETWADSQSQLSGTPTA